ncbi:unnamed protein product [Boreogadus saida]
MSSEHIFPHLKYEGSSSISRQDAERLRGRDDKVLSPPQPSGDAVQLLALNTSAGAWQVDSGASPEVEEETGGDRGEPRSM